jgi:hypothetical protein
MPYLENLVTHIETARKAFLASQAEPVSGTIKKLPLLQNLWVVGGRGGLLI